jgi:hypothetical protein
MTRQFEMGACYPQPNYAVPPGYPLSVQPYGKDTRLGMFIDADGRPQNQTNTPYSANPTANAYSYNQMIPGLSTGPPPPLHLSSFPGAQGPSVNLPYQSNTQSSPYHREPQQDRWTRSSNTPTQIINNYTTMRPFQSDHPHPQAFNSSMGMTDGKALASLFSIPVDSAKSRLDSHVPASFLTLSPD